MPGPRSLFGRLLKQIRDGINTRKVVQPERENLRQHIDDLHDGIANLPLTGLQKTLAGKLQTLRSGESGLDQLPDPESRANKLMMLSAGVPDLREQLGKGLELVGHHQTLLPEIKGLKDALSQLVDGPLKAPLVEKLTNIERAVEKAVASVNLKDLDVFAMLLRPTQTLHTEATQLLKTQKEQASQLKAFNTALNRARKDLARIDTPVIKTEVAQIQKDFIDAALVLDTSGSKPQATELLRKVHAQCNAADLKAKAYRSALAAAKLALSTAKASLLAVDVKIVETQMIGAAEREAAAGRRQPALDLLAQVKPYCDTRASSDLLAKTYSDATSFFEQLLSHPHQAEFKSEITALRQRMETARASVAAGTMAGAKMDMLLLYHDAKRQLGFADEHTLYAQRLGVVEPRIAQIEKAAPETSNAAVGTELANLKSLLDKANKKATERFYDEAKALLDQLELACNSVATLKQQHAAYATELSRVSVLVGTLPDEPDTPAAKDAAALREALKTAQAVADTQHDFARATTLLQDIGKDCDLCLVMAKSTVADTQARDQALQTLDGEPATALADVRKLLAALKTRAGHGGVAQQIGEIELLLSQAEQSLKA